MMSWRLWHLYVTRVFRLSFREPATRGIGILNLSGFVLGALVIMLVTSAMGGFARIVQKAVSVYAGDLSVISYSPISDQTRRALTEQLEARYPDRVGVYALSEAALMAGGRVTDAMIETPINGHTHFVTPDIAACLAPGADNNVVIGTPIADMLDVSPGDIVKVVVMLGDQAREFYGRVCATTAVGYYDYDKRLLWVSSGALADFWDQMMIGAKILMPDHDLSDIAAERNALQDIIGPRYPVFTWFDRNENLFRAIQTEHRLILLVTLFVVIVASFNLISHLYVHYHSRREAFQLLFVLGEQPKRMFWLSLIQGGLVGVAGSIVGVSAAFVLVTVVSRWLPIPIPVDIYKVGQLPLLFRYDAAAWIIAGSAAISMLVSAIPAISARRLFQLTHPV